MTKAKDIILHIKYKVEICIQIFTAIILSLLYTKARNLFDYRRIMKWS